METLTMDQFMAGLGRNSLQAGVLVLAVLLAQWLSGKRLAPRWRCALWLLVVVRLLVPFSFGSATSVFNLLPHWTKSAAVSPPLAEPSTPMPGKNPAPALPPVQVAEQQMNQPPEVKPMPELPVVSPAATVPFFPAPASKPVQYMQPVAHISWSLPVCIFWVWLAGVMVLLGHVLISSIRLARRCARMRPLTEPATLAVLEDCRKRLAMSTPLVTVESVEVSSPALHGLFRPRLLLPKGFTAKFSTGELRFVFLHELAHLKRRDLWMNWVMALLQAVHWFNPLVWLGFARWRDDRELACDAMVLEATGAEQNKEYGQTILRLLENFTHPLRTPGLVGILEDKRQLRRRIGMIATYAPAPRWSLLAAVLITVLTVIGLTDARSNDSTNSPSSSASTNETSIQLTVELRDGSRVTGKSLEDILYFHSQSLGDLKLPLTGIRSIEFSADGETARLTAASGDVFDVQFIAAALRVETGFGKTELPVKLIKSVRVSAAGKSGGMPAGLVALWSGEGNANDSVGGNNGQLVGSVGFALGKVGQAFDFNNGGSGDDYQKIRFGGGSGLEGFRPNRGGYVQVPDAPDQHFTDAMTVEAWVNLRTFSGVNSREIVSKIGGPNLRQGSFTLSIDPSRQKAYFIVCTTYPDSATVYSSTTIPLNQWVHLAGTYDGSTIKIYVNGQLDGTTSWDKPLFSGNNPLVIGCTLQDFSSPTSFFNGLIDEVGLFNRALSDSEIQAIYEAAQPLALPPQKAPFPPTGKTNIQTTVVSTNETSIQLTVELRDGSRVTGKSLDDPLRFHSSSLGDMKLPLAGIRSIEFSASGETARLTATNGDAFDVQFIATALRVETGFGKTELPVKLIRSIKVSAMSGTVDLSSGLVALWSAEGNGIDSTGGHNGTFPYGSAFAPGVIGQAFDFDGSRRRVNIPDSPDFKLTNALTLSAWVYPRQYAGFITIRGDNRPGLDTWTLDTYQAGYVNFTIDDAANQTISTRAPLQLNQWQLVTATWEHETGEMKVYVNGVLGSQTNTDLIPIADLDGSPDAGVGIGNSSGSFHQFPFNGLIDEVRIYNRALSDSDIQAIYETVQPNTSTLPPAQMPPPMVKTNFQTTAASTNATDFRLAIELRDGSRVTGKSLDDPWRFHSSSLGDMKLSVTGIRSIEFAADGETARLTAANGDAFDVQLLATSLRVETGFGKTELPVKLIRSVKVSPMGRIVQTQPGLVGLWAGEGDASDSAGENNATLAGNTTFTDGKVGQAFSFDGKNSFVKIPQSPGLNVGDQVTISFWMKADSDNPMNTLQGLVTSDFYGVEISNGLGGRMGVNFIVSTTANQPVNWNGQWTGDASAANFSHTSQPNGGGASVTPGQWHHIAGTYDGAKLQLYIDGRSWGNPMPETGAIRPMLPDSFVAIGSEDGRTTCLSCVANRYFKGAIDEAAIYNRALSAAEIQAIYNGEQPSGSALPPQRPPPVVKTNVQTRVANTNETGFRLTIELKDGSRVVGTSVEQYFLFHSVLLGELKLEVKDIRSIDCLTTNSVKLTTAGGNVLTVWFANPELRVNTGFGKVELSVDSIRRVVVSAAGISGRMREGLVLFWSGEGDGKGNIGTDPDTLNELDPSSIVTVHNKAALDSMQQTRQLTFEAWIKPNSIPHVYPVLLSKGGLSKGGDQPGGASGGYEFFLNSQGDNDLVFASGGCEIVTRDANGRWINHHLGEWIHVVFTIDDRTKATKFYVNGQPTNDEHNWGTSDDLNFDLPNNLYIGAPDPARDAIFSRFDGEMRDVMLFNRVLTAEEIHADYAAGHSD